MMQGASERMPLVVLYGVKGVGACRLSAFIKVFGI